MKDLAGRVAVVTGGASGVGKGLVPALLDEDVKVVIADVEERALDAAVAELTGKGDVSGVVTDVSRYESVEALADHVFDEYGGCHLLFNNAGVTSGGGGKPWEQEPNDWKWCFSVNVFGVANGVLAFAPRMIESGEEGLIINTSSGDGGFAPVPNASIYAASKAAVSTFTEALAHQLISNGTNVRACVFYPSGGLLDTGLWTAQRNRPEALARQKPRPAAPGTTIEEFREHLRKTGRNADVMDTYELGRFVIEKIKAGHYIITHGMPAIHELLEQRAAAIARFELPPALH